MSRIYLASGHNMKTVGAVAFNQTEAAININLVNQAIEILKSQDTKGREIVLVPHELDLMDSIRWVNSQSKDYAHDLALEVHLNSNSGPAGTGIETYYGMKKFAEEINTGAEEVMAIRNRGVKTANLGWNRETKMGSALIEMGFINNRSDLDAILDRGGRAIANGILKACGSSMSTPVKPPEGTPTTTNSTGKLSGTYYTTMTGMVLYHIPNPQIANQSFINWNITKPLSELYTCPKSDCSAVQSVLDEEVLKVKNLEADKFNLNEELVEVKKLYEALQKNSTTIEKEVVVPPKDLGEAIIQCWDIIKSIRKQ